MNQSFVDINTEIANDEDINCFMLFFEKNKKHFFGDKNIEVSFYVKPDRRDYLTMIIEFIGLDYEKPMNSKKTMEKIERLVSKFYGIPIYQQLMGG